MINIQQIKIDGAHDALRQAVIFRINDITARTFNGHFNGEVFKGLHTRLAKVRHACDDIDEILKAMQEINPNND